MRPLLALSAILTVACVHSAPLPPLADRTTTSPSICKLSTPEHTRFLQLRLPGGGPVFAETGRGSQGWPAVEAALVWRESAWLEVAVAGGGLLVWADVEATEREVLYAARNIELGQLGFLTMDAHLRVVGADGDQLTIRPGKHAFEYFQPVASVDQQLGCDALSLMRPEGAPKDSDAMLASLGFEPSRRAWIHVPQRVPVHASPDGEVLGHLLAAKLSPGVQVLEERDGWLRIVLSSYWTGVVWYGWLEASHEDPDPTLGLGGLGTRGTGGGPKPAWLACEARHPLFAQPKGADPTHVGWIEPGTVFEQQPSQAEDATTTAGLVSVRLRHSWLQPRNSTMLLPEAAAACPPAPTTGASP